MIPPALILRALEIKISPSLRSMTSYILQDLMWTVTGLHWSERKAVRWRFASPILRMLFMLGGYTK